MTEAAGTLGPLLAALVVGAGVAACVEITEPAPIDHFIGRYALTTVNAQELPVRVVSTFGCEIEIRSAELSIDAPDRVVMDWRGRTRCGSPDWSTIADAHGGTLVLGADEGAAVDPRCSPADDLFCFASVYFAERQPDAGLDLLAFPDADPGSGDPYLRLGYRR